MNPLELELDVFASCLLWVLGTKFWSSARAGRAGNHRAVAVSPALGNASQSSYSTNKDHLFVPQLQSSLTTSCSTDTVFFLSQGGNYGVLSHGAKTMLSINSH